MIGLEELEMLINIALFTGWIKDERPVSLLIIAKPESGKTELVRKARRVKGVLYLTDATAWGIIDKHWDEIEARIIRHIIFADITVPLGKSAETRKVLTRFLSALIEEGVVELQSYVTTRVTTVENLRCGLIATITPDALEDQRAGWRKFGFMSRLLPVSYSYTVDTIGKIYQSILDHQYRQEKPVDPKLPNTDVAVYLPRQFAEAIKPYSMLAAQAEELYGFRIQKQFQTLMMGAALFNGRQTVTEDDYDLIVKLIPKYFNTNCNPV